MEKIKEKNINAWFVCPYQSDCEFRINSFGEESYKSKKEANIITKELSLTLNDEGGYYFGVFRLVKSDGHYILKNIGG